MAPILAYGCEVWLSLVNRNLKESIDKFKLKFLKSILTVRQQTPTIGVLRELATYPATTSMYTKTVNYWLGLKQLPESNISKHVYLYLPDLHNLDHRT